MVFHKCVMAVIGVLAVSASAAAGPIKFGERSPSLDVGQLRGNGVRMSQDELRALFFPGDDARNARASCGDCLIAQSSLSGRERSKNKHASYGVVFPFSSQNLYRAPTASAPPAPTRPSSGAVTPDLLTGAPANTAAVVAPALVVAGQPLSTNVAMAPLAAAAASAVPEPTTIVLIGTGLAGAWIVRRRNRSTLAS